MSVEPANDNTTGDSGHEPKVLRSVIVNRGIVPDSWRLWWNRNIRRNSAKEDLRLT